MKRDLLRLIVCPSCGGNLTLTEFDATGSGDAVESGALTCAGCEAVYPIIERIPRLLPVELQTIVWEMHPEFFRAHADHFPRALIPRETKAATSDDGALAAQHDTARSFGYEWQAFSEMLPEYEINFRWYFERFAPDDFKDRLVLDAGCGTGRHTFHAARSGAREVIAVDFSQAIEVAARNNRENANTHFIQADIYHLPFRPETFDFAYSLGVLHHLPDPERGFRALVSSVKEGGFINIYLYWNLEGEAAWRRALLKGVTQARRVTTRMPHTLLHRLSWLVAAGFHVAFVLPSRALASSPATARLADRVPLGHYRKYPFRMLYTDQFDRFSAPIENRYGRAEVAAWLERAGISDMVILGGMGWRASGRR